MGGMKFHVMLDREPIYFVFILIGVKKLYTFFKWLLAPMNSLSEYTSVEIPRLAMKCRNAARNSSAKSPLNVPP